jgi:RNA polymerase sigma factor (sigma-70 family)
MGTDQSLLRACQEGDRIAWQTLLDRYERLVYSIPLNFGLSRSDAEDIAQTTFAALLRSLDAITEADRLGAWLGTVARRQTWRFVEKRRREPPTDDDRLDHLATEDTAIVQAENLQWLHQGLAEIDERCRQLLTQLYFSEDPPAYAQVAQSLGVPVGSIGPTRARCLEKLRLVLETLRDD